MILQKKKCLILIGVFFVCVSLWIFKDSTLLPRLSSPATQPNEVQHQTSPGVIPSSFPLRLAERRQLLREQCLTKPPNPSFIEEADFSRFIVIEKLKLVFCFIPKISCTTWKRVLYSAKNQGEQVGYNPHRRGLFSWLNDYNVFERKEILKNYYKAMFVREPFARLASAYKYSLRWLWIKRFVYPNKSTEELKKTGKPTFPTFIKRVLSTNQTTLRDLGHIEDQHWQSYEQICPCEVNYDFIGHFENLAEEAPQLLKITGADDFVTFPEYHPSKSAPYMLDYYSQLTKDEIIQLGELYELDFKLFGYDFPGPLEEILKNKTITEEN
ncbi:carbohydrate sulfotransferase 11-like [Oculina patagonica]